METKPSASPCPPTDVRWMSPSPNAQRPIVYHLVVVPRSVVACMSIWIHVPAGVSAFQDDTSSVNPKPV